MAFREFSIITEDTIVTERRKFRAQIADEIESFSKRAAVRNLKTNGKFTKDQISIIYDKFFAALCTADPAKDNGQVSGNSTPPGAANPADEGRIETRIDLRTFRCASADLLDIFSHPVLTWTVFLLSLQDVPVRDCDVGSGGHDHCQPRL